MKLVMTLWKEDPLKCRGFPEAPLPFSPASTSQVTNTVVITI
jgi:hypothetical protein